MARAGPRLRAEDPGRGSRRSPGSRIANVDVSVAAVQRVEASAADPIRPDSPVQGHWVTPEAVESGRPWCPTFNVPSTGSAARFPDQGSGRWLQVSVIVAGRQRDEQILLVATDEVLGPGTVESRLAADPPGGDPHGSSDAPSSRFTSATTGWTRAFDSSTWKLG